MNKNMKLIGKLDFNRTKSVNYVYINDKFDRVKRNMNWIEKKERAYKIFNLGVGKNILTQEIAEIINETLGLNPINNLTIQVYDGNIGCFDISNYSEIVIYNLNYIFKQGINKFDQWYLESR